MNKSILAKAVTVAMIGMAGIAYGAEKSKKPVMELTPEQRQTMAASHEQMATCLRSEKTMDECRTDMMKSCESTMGKDGCPMMMGKMQGMHGMHGMPGKMKSHKMNDEKESEK